jgi:CubicO group peptidase (beta-lactamase class C family)
LRFTSLGNNRKIEPEKSLAGGKIVRARYRTIIFIFAAIAVGAVGWAWQKAPAPEATSPAAPATERLSAYIKAFNSGSADEMRQFFKAHYAALALQETSVDARIARYSTTLSSLKSFTIQRIVAERPYESFALTKAGNGEDFLLRAAVEKVPPHKLLFIFLEPVDDPKNITIPDPKADDKELVAAVGAFLDARSKADEFSGVVLIAKDFRTLFHEAYGDADREQRIPNRKDTKFNLGSINKSFTHSAVLKLEREGRLSLDDPIGKFLPDYPNRQAAAQVTVRHLLNMTSGIEDFFGARYDATPKDKIRSIRDYLPLFADQPLEFEPGTSHRYSNGGYIVLGAIIEKVTGTDYYTYVRENIFKPCGMSDTDSYERDKGPANLALGYTHRGQPGGERVLNHQTLPGRGSSAGGGYSTAADLLKYVRALSAGKIFLPDIANGMGIAGGAPGINSAVEWDPRRGYLVIVLTNFDPPTAGAAARQIVSWLPE